VKGNDDATQSKIHRPSEIEGYEETDSAERKSVAGAPARKWEWEKELLSRSRAEGMTTGSQHIALVLSTYGDGDGRDIRPTIATLAAVTGRGQSTVKEALRYLREHGWVHQVSRGQTGRASEYRLTIPPRVQ
jgi:hypothetical protein